MRNHDDDDDDTPVDLEREVFHTLNGERITDEFSEAAAEAAERRIAGLVPGGKSLSGEGKHSPVVQVRVSEATQGKLKRIAEARRMSVSKLSRQVLDEFVAKAQ